MARGHRHHARARQHAINELEGADADAITFLEPDGALHALTIDARAIPAAQVFEDGLVVLDRQARMPPRDERVVERDEAVRASPEDGFARREIELLQQKSQTMTQKQASFEGGGALLSQSRQNREISRLSRHEPERGALEARAMAPLAHIDIAGFVGEHVMRVLVAPLLLAIGHPSLALASNTGPQQPEPVAYPATAPSAEGAHVLLRTNRKDVALERRAGSVDVLQDDGTPAGTASLWARVCIAPCQVVVGAGEELRIAGEGIAPSPSFKLDPRSRAVRIDADAGSQRARTVGKTFVSTGIGLMALGTVLLVVPASGDDPSSTSAFDTLRTLGYGALGAGGALTLIGIPLWVSNGTTVTISSSASPGHGAPTAIVVGARRVHF